MVTTIIALLCVATLCLMSRFVHAQSNFSLDDIRFGDHGNKLRIVLDLNSASNFRAFTLSSPYRVVLDLPAFTPKFDQKSGGISGGKQDLIKQYRYGTLEPGVSRLVFETKRPAVIKNLFFLPPAKGQAYHRLVMDVEPVSPAAFKAMQNDILGVRDADKLALVGQAASPSIRADRSPQTRAEKSTPPIKAKPRQPKIIMIDAGHGGNDPGAISVNKSFEKDITIAIAKKLKAELEKTGRYKPVLTRTGDYYIKLRDRVRMAREAGADLFISIHADSMHRNSVRGASVYTLSETSSDKETARLAERENRSDIIAGVALENEVDEVANILLDLAVRDTMNQSKQFANIMVDSFKSNGLRLLPNTHRYAGFAVLKAPDVPSILIETGYLSNRKDADLLKRPDHQRKLARAILNGIERYFNNL